MRLTMGLTVLLMTACGTAPSVRCDTSCTGCCTADGRCESGNSSSACGSSGRLCSSCSAQATCTLGTCVDFSGAGGGSSGVGGGAAGGTQAGGAAAGGLTAGGRAGGTAAAGGTAGGTSTSRVGCAGLQYTEALPTNTSLGGLTSSPAMAQQYLLQALELRYPHGKALVEGGLANPVSPQQSNCVALFLQDTSSANAVLRQASTLVHECGHFYDIGLSRSTPGARAYVIAPALQRSCRNGDTTMRGGRTFARSLLTSDTFSSMRPPCVGSSSMNCDFYANTYLDGSPTNSTFESGDQGFDLLLEEANQYVNSLASGLAFRDAYQQGSRVTERDGILTFMWYLERYLLLARTSYPQAYSTITQDACWRESILSVWDRGWFYLQASAPYASTLGINDARLRTLVETPSLLAEIDTLRRLQCPP